MTLTTEGWLALGALIVAVVAIPITMWTTRRWGTRRRRLLFARESTPLIPTAPAGAGSLLKVTFRDLPVEEPHLVTLSLDNVGPVDVASGHFDAGRPVEIKLGCTLYGVVSSTHPRHTISPAVGTSDAIIGFPPMLLKRGERWAVEVVVSGTPNPNLVSSLIDTDIEEYITFTRMAASSRAGRIFLPALSLAIGEWLIRRVIRPRR